MATFEIRVNGERRFSGREVTAITLAVDPLSPPKRERISVIVGVGDPLDPEVQYLGSDLVPGDELSISVLEDEERPDDAGEAPDCCSFCGGGVHLLRSLVAGPQVAICDSCLESFEAALRGSAPLPVGASMQDGGEALCGFCLRKPPEVAGLLVRNMAAVCPECLRACVDIARPERGQGAPT
jgi:hypothetical protein